MNQFDKYLERYREEGINYLRENVPEIKRLETLDDLKELELVNETDIDVVVVLEYKATAPNLLPYVRQRLLDKDIVKSHNLLSTSLKDKGTPNEIYSIRMGFYGSKLQISLDIHK